jgi:hypothetical protein
MSNEYQIPILARPAFFGGQMLGAADLNQLGDYHQALRWLHNSTLHNWGIAAGLDVAGKRGERSVMIGGGYALDTHGRDLILGERVEMPVPAVAGDAGGKPKQYFLTACYAADPDLAPEVRAGACGASGAVRRTERPILRFQDPTDVGSPDAFRPGLDIVLAGVRVLNCMLAKDVSMSERRDAASAPQSYISAGQSEAGGTAWKLWRSGNPTTGTPVGVVATVLTVDAGFRATPRYQARLSGERTFKRAGGGNALADGYAHIANASASGFELRVSLPAGATTDPVTGGITQLNPPEVLKVAFMSRLKSELNWHVVWMGIEG